MEIGNGVDDEAMSYFMPVTYVYGKCHTHSAHKNSAVSPWTILMLYLIMGWGINKEVVKMWWSCSV